MTRIYRPVVVIAGEKECRDCGQWKPLDDFYRSSRQVHSHCKLCANARRSTRQKANREWLLPINIARKSKWAHAHPERKRIIEKRSIVLHKPASPALLKDFERVLMQLGALVAPRRPKPV